ncbi:MAG: AAA family ATPase [Robiginitomaculum sp.]|nr:AAA family ATPase [Robiginitomaculum sp.]
MTQPQISPVTTPQAYPAPGQGAPSQGAARPLAAPVPAPFPGQSPIAPQQVQQSGTAPLQAMPVQQGYVQPEPQGGFPPMPQQPQQQSLPHSGMPSAAVPTQGAPIHAPAIAAPMVERDKEGGEKALPRIAIHAFCERTETAATIQSTTQDWRMGRTNLKVYMGGLPAAIEYYKSEGTPSLIIFESRIRGQELFAQLEQLASVCDADTKVVMIGAVNDIKLYRDLMDQGLSEYLVPPFHPLTLIRSIADLYTDPEKPFVGKVIAFFGAKGGAGSSTIAHNIAWGMATKMLQETALVDMDSSWGTTGLDFNYDSSQGLEEALADPERLDETLLDRIMIRHTEKLSILPAAASLGSTAPTSPASYEALVNGMRGLSPMTLLDMPHVWSKWSKQILESADEIVITATPDLANLRNAKNLIEYLKTARPNDPDPLLILNKTGVPKTAEIPVKEFAAAVGISPALVLAYEPVIYTEASNDGKMLSDLKTAAAAFEGIMYLAQRLRTGEFPAPITKKKGLKIGKSKSGKKEKKSGGLLAGLRKRK